jgi:hypothetical protein
MPRRRLRIDFAISIADLRSETAGRVRAMMLNCTLRQLSLRARRVALALPFGSGSWPADNRNHGLIQSGAQVRSRSARRWKDGILILGLADVRHHLGRLANLVVRHYSLVVRNRDEARVERYRAEAGWRRKASRIRSVRRSSALGPTFVPTIGRTRGMRPARSLVSSPSLQTITEGVTPRQMDTALSTLAIAATAKWDEARIFPVIARRAPSDSTTITRGENPATSVGRRPPRR